MPSFPLVFKDITLEYIEEAFTSENWLVRIYKVKHPENRPVVKKNERQIIVDTKKVTKVKNFRYF